MMDRGKGLMWFVIGSLFGVFVFGIVEYRAACIERNGKVVFNGLHLECMK